MDRQPIFWQRLLVPEQWGSWVAAVPSAGGQHIAAARPCAVCGGCDWGELLRQVPGASTVLQVLCCKAWVHKGTWGVGAMPGQASFMVSMQHGGYVEVMLKTTCLLYCT